MNRRFQRSIDLRLIDGKRGDLRAGLKLAVLKRTRALNRNLSLQIISATSSSRRSVIGCFLPKCTLGIGVHSHLERLMFTSRAVEPDRS